MTPTPTDMRAMADELEAIDAGRTKRFEAAAMLREAAASISAFRAPVLHVQKRIMARVTIDEGGCWVSSYSKLPSGYAKMAAFGKLEYVHRVAYEAWKGAIPDGLQIDHLCRNTSCCNPEHLEAVTPRVNVLRAPKSFAHVCAKKTHCPKGHPYSGHNLVIHKSGGRRCRECNRQRMEDLRKSGKINRYRPKKVVS